MAVRELVPSAPPFNDWPYTRLRTAVSLYGKTRCTHYRLVGIHDWILEKGEIRSKNYFICKVCKLRVRHELVKGNDRNAYLRPYIQYPGGLKKYNDIAPINIYEGGNDVEYRFCLRCGSEIQLWKRNLEACLRKNCFMASCVRTGYCCRHDPGKTNQHSLDEWL